MLLGLGMRRVSVAELATEFRPWTWAALAFMFLTGIPMFLSEAVRMSFSSPFFVETILLSAALPIHFTIHR